MKHEAAKFAGWTALFLSLTMPVSATVLTFDMGGTLNQSVDDAYGDNVTATIMGGFGYGAAGGFTPNVTVSYGPSTIAAPGGCTFNAIDSCVFFWDTGYSNLTNVIGQSNRGANTGLIQLVLTAASGALVQLNSLDLGAFGSGLSINGVTVLDASSSVVFSSGGLGLSGTTALTVSPNVSSTQLTLLVDASNLGAGTAELVAIDNVSFSELSAVPEPATFALAGLALAGVGLLRRRA